MQVLQVILDGEGCWPDLEEKSFQVVHLGNGAPAIQMAGLHEGMTSGKPSVSIRLDLPNGTIVVAETSLALLLTAADALKAHYGDPREDHKRDYPHPRAG